MGKKEEIGIRIRTMRKSRNMTQEDLARSIGQSPSSITMYETGRRSPDYETLEALADIFNVPMSSIVSESMPDDPLLNSPHTIEARLLAQGVDNMPKEQREQALNIMKTVFVQYADYFNQKENDNDDAEL